MVWGIVLSLVFAFAWRSMATEQGGVLAERLAGIDANHTPWIFSWTPQCDWLAEDVPHAQGRIWSPLASWQTPDGPYVVEHLAGKTFDGDLLVLFRSARHNWQMVNASVT